MARFSLTGSSSTLDEQLSTLHDEILDEFIKAKGGSLTTRPESTPSLLNGLVLRPHYISLLFNLQGNWANPHLQLHHQPALLDMVKFLRGFVPHKQTITGLLETEGEKPYFEAKIYSVLNFSLPPRMLLRATSSDHTTKSGLRIVVIYAPKT